jgi:hypothetical protein
LERALYFWNEIVTLFGLCNTLNKSLRVIHAI